MLNGIAPIFLFNFFKLTPQLQSSLNKIPIVSDVVNKIGLPPIPLYLDERLTGIYVNAENRNIDLDTEVETLKDGSEPVERQRALNSSVTIELEATQDSIGLTILSAMMDVILPKVTSREYSITYLHGAVTVFNGKLDSFSINQNADNTLYRITVVLTRSTQKTKLVEPVPVVSRVQGLVPL
jgi:hypothetical protein